MKFNTLYEYTKDQINGGLADKVTPEDIAKKHNVPIKYIEKQLAMGMKIEMEHTNHKMIAREISLDHLFEIPDYYTRLAKMEKAAEVEH